MDEMQMNSRVAKPISHRPRALISLCLLGAACRYDGRGNGCAGIEDLMEHFELIPICPEQLGGLPTPRPPSERRGDGVVTREGIDVTAAFRRGADEACALARRFSVKCALLKQRSPSCGTREIYDGTFSGARLPGMGMAAQALSTLGVRLYDENTWRQMIEDSEDEANDTL